MGRLLFGLMFVGVLLTATGAIASADEAKDEAIRKDHKLIEGTWRIVALEINGEKVKGRGRQATHGGQRL
jgi:hypothetical protein